MSYSRFRSEALRQDAIRSDIYQAVHEGNVEWLKNILDETGFNIHMVDQDRVLSASTGSGNLKMLFELMKMGLLPQVKIIATALGASISSQASLGTVTRIHGTATYANRVYPELKAFLFLLAQPGVQPYFQQIDPRSHKKIYAYLSNPDNRPMLIAALAEVNEFAPLSKEKGANNSGPYQIREYLAKAGVENVPELISEAVKSSFAATRRAYALLHRHEASKQSILAARASEGGAPAAASEGGAPAAAASAPLRRISIQGSDIKVGDGRCYYFGTTYLGRLVRITGLGGVHSEPDLHFEKGQIINMFNEFLVVPCQDPPNAAAIAAAPAVERRAADPEEVRRLTEIMMKMLGYESNRRGGRRTKRKSRKGRK